ncbi:hypothetical protein HDU96_002809 [Phlyctochytrium bullatum]|nr:hypothetical protein HDU96_002809 [Phlyctochytrium bullatum]
MHSATESSHAGSTTLSAATPATASTVYTNLVQGLTPSAQYVLDFTGSFPRLTAPAGHAPVDDGAPALVRDDATLHQPSISARRLHAGVSSTLSIGSIQHSSKRGSHDGGPTVPRTHRL